MTVLHVHSGNLFGGVEQLLLTLARFGSIGPQLDHHFALCFDAQLARELRRFAVPIYLLGDVRVRRLWSVWRARRRLRALLAQQSFDAVICHSAWAQALFGRVACSAGSALIFWLHQAASGKHWTENWARRLQPDFALCSSRFIARQLANVYPNVPHAVIYCPVASNFGLRNADCGFSNPKSEIRNPKLPAGVTPDDATIIIQVSRLDPIKGHRLHLEALALLRDVPSWVAWIVATARRRQELRYLLELKRLARKLRIADRVCFIQAANADQVPALLAQADIYCQPNTGPEGFGIAFVEAMQVGLPVVTTHLGAAEEVIGSQCGVLAPVKAEAVASALRKLIENPALRATLGENGPARARELCDPARRIIELAACLADIRRTPMEAMA